MSDKPFLFNAGAMGTVVRDDGAVLLLRRQKEPYAGMWAMPGGKIEPGEHPDAAIVREFREETGLETEVERFCGILSEIYESPHGRGQFFIHLFRLKVTGGSLVESGEGPLQWVQPAELGTAVIPSDAWMIHNLVLQNAPIGLTTLNATEASVMIRHRYT